MTNRTGQYAALVLAFLPGIFTSAKADSGQQITVTVDSRVVNFPGTQPMETNGSVLVPLRGVFEALHAEVDYDSSDNTITATRGDRTVVVPIGATTATINGQSQSLSQPAEVYNGTTLVPLRFVAEALGDYVQWNGDTNTVAIVRHGGESDMDANPPAEPMASADSSTVVIGRLHRIDTDTQPAHVMVFVGGQPQDITLSRDVTIQRGAHRDDLMSVGVNDLQPGDRVVIHENGRGHAESIVATFGTTGQ